MEWLPLFIVGWFGSVWWPGIEVDAPPPGGDPWWWRLAIGIIGGIAAIYVVRLSGMNSDPMPGFVLGIAAGCVAGRIVGALKGAMRKG